jgi:hypothetical protein
VVRLQAVYQPFYSDMRPASSHCRNSFAPRQAHVEVPNFDRIPLTKSDMSPRLRVAVKRPR